MQAEIQIIAIPAFKDNYIWLIHNGVEAIAVDPGDPRPVLETLSTLKLNLTALLITHHHQDHIGGVEALLSEFENLEVFAPAAGSYDFAHTPVSEPQEIKITHWLPAISIINLPGHTLDHVAYCVQHQPDQWLFCGDTLFGAGCGRLFEGSASQMVDSLRKLASLPPETKVFCAHEYTLHNINFALTLEPKNMALRQRKAATEALRHDQQPSLPSTIALELATNPFLRCDSAEIKANLQLKNADAIKIFSEIRSLRNNY